MKLRSASLVQSSSSWARRSIFFLLFTPVIVLAGCFRMQGSLPAPELVVPGVHEPAGGAYEKSVRTVTLGYSVEGRPLVMTVFGAGSNPVLIFGGIHGHEPTGAQLAQRLVRYLGRNPHIWRRTPIAILPQANPDGLVKGTRQNINGVDCNRNFAARNWRRSRAGHRFYGGPRALSEPETRAIVKAVQMLEPRFIVAIHSMADGGFCNNYDGPARFLAQIMARENHYPVKGSIGYPTPGSFGSWAGIDKNIPTITLELPREKSVSRVWLTNRDAILSAVQTRIGR